MHKDGFQFGHRRKDSRPSHLHSDGFEQGFGRSNPRDGLVHDGIARRTAPAGNTRPIRQGVDFNYNAVNLVGELPAQVMSFVIVRNDLIGVNLQHRLDAISHPPELLGGQAQVGQGFQHFPMSLEFHAFHCAKRVEHRPDRALGHEFWVELLEGSGSSIARVREGFFTGGSKNLVERRKILDGNIGFAAHFEQGGGRRGMQFQRDATNGFEVCGDVIALDPVAARDSERQFTMAIMEADGYSIHFRFNDVLDFFAAQMFPDGGVKSTEFGQGIFILRLITLFPVRFLLFGRLFGRLDFIQREHGPEMFNANKFFAGSTANTLGGGFRGNQGGKIFFQHLQLQENPVILPVGDLLAALNIVVKIMPADFPGELQMTISGLLVCHGELLPASGKKNS